MADLPAPVDGLQQLPLALTGVAPGSLAVPQQVLALAVLAAEVPGASVQLLGDPTLAGLGAVRTSDTAQPQLLGEVLFVQQHTSFAAEALLHPTESKFLVQELFLPAVLALGHHPAKPLEVLTAVPAAELEHLVLPVQDLRLATEEAVAVVTAQVNAPLRACALELGPAAGAAELVDCAINLVVVTGVREAAAAEAAGSGRASEPCLLHFVRGGTAQGTEQAGLAITIHM